MATVITGANAIFKINGEPFLFASGVSVDHENRLEEIPQLDSLVVAEYAENGHRCTIHVNFFKLAPGATMNDDGVTAIANSAGMLGLDSPSDVREILLQPVSLIEIVVEDLDGNENTVYIGYDAKFAGGTGAVDARGVWTGSYIWKCKTGTGI